jgi:diacylglycerol kinase family enzyme
VHDVPEVVLTARVPQPFQVDGEDLGDRTRVVFRSVPGALSVVV